MTGSVEETAGGLGRDAGAYRRLLGPLVRDVGLTLPEILAPDAVRARGTRWRMARFGLDGLPPATVLARRFRTEEARALLAGVAAHSMLPLSAPVTGAFGLLLTMAAHAVGWPVVEGGSARLADALLAELASLGGAGGDRPVGAVAGRACRPPGLSCSTSRRASCSRWPATGCRPRHRAALRRFRYGPGVCKVDWALSGPVPWAAAACREAGTVHLGGTLAEVARSEAEVTAGRLPERPYCMVAQPGVADPTRAPAGQHTLWAYCHVPSGSHGGHAARLIEAQIERFAPGFRDLILARSVRTAADMERYNPNYVGGDINGGAGTLLQTVLRPDPAVEPVPDRRSPACTCAPLHPAGRRRARHVRRGRGPRRPRRPGPARTRLAGRLAEPGQVAAQHLFHLAVEAHDQPQLVVAVPGGHLLPVAHHRPEYVAATSRSAVSATSWITTRRRSRGSRSRRT